MSKGKLIHFQGARQLTQINLYCYCLFLKSSLLSNAHVRICYKIQNWTKIWIVKKLRRLNDVILLYTARIPDCATTAYYAK